jgi:hypothetical protein
VPYFKILSRFLVFCTPQGGTKKSTPQGGIELNDRLSGVLSIVPP